MFGIILTPGFSYVIRRFDKSRFPPGGIAGGRNGGGGRFVVVDPRRTESAGAADEHIFIRPSTDAAVVGNKVRELTLGVRASGAVTITSVAIRRSSRVTPSGGGPA